MSEHLSPSRRCVLLLISRLLLSLACISSCSFAHSAPVSPPPFPSPITSPWPTAAATTTAGSLYHQLSAVRYLNDGLTTSSSVYGYQHRDVQYGELENITGVNEWWGGQSPFPILYESDYEPRQVCTAGNVTAGQRVEGGDIGTVVLDKPSVDECQAFCCHASGCVAFVVSVAAVPAFECEAGDVCCYLKSSVVGRVADSNATSGTVEVPSSPFVVHPTSGMRSAVPLGGAGAGSVELRADGTFHEWTIVNQSPGGAAKYGVVDDCIMAVYKQSTGDSSDAQARTVRTHSPRSLPGVSGIRYRGSYPVGRLDLVEPALPVTVSVYSYFALKPTDLNRSATPAFVLSANIHNPFASQSRDVAFMWSLPFGVESDTSRLSGPGYANLTRDSAVLCMEACAEQEQCASWTFTSTVGLCTLQSDVPLNYYAHSYSSGVKGQWTWQQRAAAGYTDATGSAALSAPLQHVRAVDASGPAYGDLSLWPVVSSCDGLGAE